MVTAERSEINSSPVSTSTSDASDTNLLQYGEARKFPQYFAAFAASLSAFSTGNAIAWTSQISSVLLDEPYNNFEINEDQLGWIGSFMALGAAVLSLFVGYLCDRIGRKLTKLFLMLPMLVGWILIVEATGVEMIYIGRFLTGMAAGAYLVTAPLYCNEISEREIRGTLGSLTQLMVSFGILFDVIAGKFLSIRIYTICCAVVPVIFAVIFGYMPESPTYYMKKNREGDAKKSLLRLRGKNYDVDGEILEIKTVLENETEGNLWQVLKESSKRRSTRLAFVISLNLMILRVLCGIDAVTTYTTYIFLGAAANFDPQIGTIIMMTVQVMSGGFQSVLIDRVGRRILLLVSEMAMSLCLFTIAVCFLLKNQEIIDEQNYVYADYILLIALAVYVIGFSLGIAPIPLILNAEINPHETRSIVASFATFCAWLIIFVVTKTFLIIEQGIGAEGAFFIYGGFSFIGFWFILFLVPETKNKTPGEIQALLEKK